MLFNFIFSHLNTIILAVWLAFFAVVFVRTHKAGWVWHFPYQWLVVIAVILHILYGAFLTWGQYVVWQGSEFTKMFLSSPLSPEVPFPSYFGFVRPLFNGAHGYFAFYAFEHFFLSSIALFVVTGLFALFFRMYAVYRPALFQKGDIAIITLALLIAGWPGAFILVPLSFILAIALALLFLFQFDINIKNKVSLPSAFLYATPLALLFATPVLTVFHLYSLLKL